MNQAQFNLLPDVKLQHVNTELRRRLVVSSAVLAAGATLAIAVFMFFAVNVVQKKQLNDADKDIKTTSARLQQIPELNKILTVRHQLETLTTLHKQKHITSRLFTYLTQITPANVSINSTSVDFANNTIEISGTARSQHGVNTYVDTVKFTTFSNGVQSKKAAFSSVVQTSFSIGDSVSTFSLRFNFDPELFSNSLVDDQGRSITPRLDVPSLTTTRSVTNDPGNVLFSAPQQSGGNSQ